MSYPYKGPDICLACRHRGAALPTTGYNHCHCPANTIHPAFMRLDDNCRHYEPVRDMAVCAKAGVLKYDSRKSNAENFCVAADSVVWPTDGGPTNE